MNYLLIFHPEAEKEYIEAYMWYEEKSEGLGTRFESMVEKKLERIQDNPEIFGYTKGLYREALVDVFPYTIVYKVDKRRRAVYISAIYHTSRNPVKKFRIIR